MQSEATMAQKGIVWPANSLRRVSEIGMRITLYATCNELNQMGFFGATIQKCIQDTLERVMLGPISAVQ
jgi:hypothetical protein